MKQIQKLYPHLVAILGFVLVAVLYFYPVLQGKKIYQSDIVQYTAMAKEQNDFRWNEQTEPYWTDAAFGGMPTYQLGAKYPNDFIGHLDDALRFLPRPADYLFLYFLGFYALLLVLKTDPLKAFFGALAFGFSTYLIIILGVGHNAKAHAIAYMPVVVAGTLLVFKRKYILGGIVTMLAVALELNANHFQMTYYLLFLLLILGGYYSYKLIVAKDFKSLGTILGTFLIALILALGVNATNLLATKEYANFSTRSKSDLKLNEMGKPKTDDSALSRSYITEYSYGVTESLNLIAPRLFGGGNGEMLDEKSNLYEFLLGYGATHEEALQTTQYYGKTYWGDQPIVAAPAYIGAVVFFLAVLALFHDKRKIKYVFLAGTLLSLVLSWGKNFELLTNFFIDFIPLYDKFRAVSSIQVVLELCMPVLAIMGFQSFFSDRKEHQWESLKRAGAVSFGLIVLLFVSKSLFSFSGPMDGQLIQMFSQSQDKSFGVQFVNALVEDRKSLFNADLLRSGFFIIIVFGILWMYIKEKLAVSTAVILVGVFMVADLFFVDKNYVSNKDFVSAREVDVPFEATNADLQILQDSSHYRVLEVEGNLSSARASYFHKSIGGYHAAKPRRMQELFDYQIANNNKEVLDMLHVKYIIQSDEEGKQFPTLNSNANGNAWFVEKIKFAGTTDDEMKALSKFDSKKEAIVNQKEFGVFFKADPITFKVDSTATIHLSSYKPNHLIYNSNNANDGFAVFSEMYYADGWNAYIDGKLTSHMRVNYALRAMTIPSGKHAIEFKFEPQVVKTGSLIALISSIGMLLAIATGIYLERRKSQKLPKEQTK
ncbi:MAG: hypothetical protein RLZZ231_1091 [Bacteroidota bacterium]